jgi:hypothetical protein
VLGPVAFLDCEDGILLTESEVHRCFRKLFSSAEITEEALEKAEALIEQLRLESPLRHRLTEELDELRRLCTVDN